MDRRIIYGFIIFIILINIIIIPFEGYYYTPLQALSACIREPNSVIKSVYKTIDVGNEPFTFVKLTPQFNTPAVISYKKIEIFNITGWETDKQIGLGYTKQPYVIFGSNDNPKRLYTNIISLKDADKIKVDGKRPGMLKVESNSYGNYCVWYIIKDKNAKKPIITY
jgi:hypothetical protein